MVATGTTPKNAPGDCRLSHLAISRDQTGNVSNCGLLAPECSKEERLNFGPDKAGDRNRMVTISVTLLGDLAHTEAEYLIIREPHASLR